ncbi:MAG: helix-turn-helix transcriptional regulator [Sphingomonadales bacterium]|nr:helix-turn-helix transcriptional regulator [Sphingomonadales bacterium]
MTLQETFAANLRRLREDKGLSQEELAFRGEIDRTYISSLERLEYCPTLDMVEKLSKALKVDPLELLTPARGARK